MKYTRVHETKMNRTCAFPFTGVHCEVSLADSLGLPYLLFQWVYFLAMLFAFIVSLEAILYYLYKHKKLLSTFDSKLFAILLQVSFFGMLFLCNFDGLRFSEFCYFWAAMGVAPNNLCLLAPFLYLNKLFCQTPLLSWLYRINANCMLIYTVIAVNGVIFHGFTDNFCYAPVSQLVLTIGGFNNLLVALSNFYMGLMTVYTAYIFSRMRVWSTVLLCGVCSLANMLAVVMVGLSSLHYLSSTPQEIALPPTEVTILTPILSYSSTVLSVLTACFASYLLWYGSIRSCWGDVRFRVQFTLYYSVIISSAMLLTWLIAQISSSKILMVGMGIYMCGVGR